MGNFSAVPRLRARVIFRRSTILAFHRSNPAPSSETQGQLAGTIECSWWKFTRELKQRRFSTTHFNRKWGLFPFNMTWRCKIWFLSFFTLEKTIQQKILAKPLLRNVKSRLSVGVRRWKTLLQKIETSPEDSPALSFVSFFWRDISCGIHRNIREARWWQWRCRSDLRVSTWWRHSRRRILCLARKWRQNQKCSVLAG